MSKTVKIFSRIVLLILLGLILLKYGKNIYQARRAPLEIHYLLLKQITPVYDETPDGKLILRPGETTLMPGSRYPVISDWQQFGRPKFYKIQIPGGKQGWIKYQPEAMTLDEKSEAEGGTPSITPLELDEELMKKA